MQIGRTFTQSILWRGLYYLSAFVLNILIARHFLASVSGNIYYISSVYSLFLLFISLSMESGIIYFASRNEIAVGKMFNFAALWSLITGLIIFFMIYFFYPNIFSGITRSFLLFSSIAFICGNLLTTYCTGLFYAKNDFLTPNFISVVINLVLILFFPFGNHSIVSFITSNNFFYIYFISFLLQGIFIAVAVQVKYIHFRFEGFLSVAEFRLLFRYCLMAYLSNLIFFLLYRVDYWFVERYCSPVQLGNYIQVSKIGQMFFILPTILASVVFPLTAIGKKETINHLLTLLSRSILLLYFVACLILVLVGYWAFPFVYGKSFIEMYLPFCLLVPGILSLSGLFILTAFYSGKNRIDVNIKGSLLALMVIVIADRIFIPVYGINAAALVSSIGYIVYQVYVLIIFKKEFNTSTLDFFIFKLSDWKDLRNNIFQSITSSNENQQ